MAMYKITVEKSEYVKRVVGKDWAVLNEAGERGYTPEIEKTVLERQDIYEQTVEELDLAKLVAVVNNLNGAGT